MNQKQENAKCKIKCGKHEDETIKFIDISTQPNINSQNNQITFCNRCLSEFKQQGYLFNIKDIIQNQVIKNWPYQQEQINKSSINDEVMQVIPSLQQNVINLCQEFKNKISIMIDSYQNQITSSLSNLSNAIQSLQGNDGKTAQKEISNVLLNNQTIDNLEKQLKNLIASLDISKKNNKIDPIESITLKVNESKKIPDQINIIQNDILVIVDNSLKHSIDKINSLFKIPVQQEESILKQLSIKPTSLMGNQNGITIQNNLKDIVIQLNPQNRGYQAVSDYIFDKNNKYLIRIQIDYNESNYPMIGLIRKDQVNIKQLHSDFLSYYQNDYGFKKVLKGSSFYYVLPQEIEMFISFPDNKMQISDYPDHKNVCTLENSNNNLNTFQNLCLGFSVGDNKKINYTIKYCSIITDNPKWVL